MEGASSLASLVAGLLFGIGWLLWIDGVAFVGTEYDKAVNGAHYIPGFMSTIALFMLNLITWEAVSESYSLMEDGGGAFAKCWVFVAFCLSFAGLIGAIWILVAEVRRHSLASPQAAHRLDSSQITSVAFADESPRLGGRFGERGRPRTAPELNDLWIEPAVPHCQDKERCVRSRVRRWPSA